MKNTIFIIITLLFSVTLNAQSISSSDLYEKNNGRTLKLAKEAKRTGNYYLALEYYKLVYQKDSASNNFDLLCNLADLHRATHNYILSEYFYKKVIKHPSFEKYPDAFFYLAQMQKSLGKHADAIYSLNQLKKYTPSLEPTIKKLIKTELDGCALYSTLKNKPFEGDMQHLNTTINKSHIEFSPIPLNDNTFIFGSSNITKEAIYTLKEFDSLPIPRRKFYVAKKEGKEWKKTSEFTGPFNSEDIDVGNGCFSQDSSRFYFTRCGQNELFQNICQIFVSKKTKKGWSEPEALNELVNMPGFTSSHPTIGRESKKNMEVIYFVSDREGSKGGTDIWFTIYDAKKNSYKKPRNAGSKINSVGNEVTPFYDLASKTLYYSTDGKPNIGGLDIYKNIGETSTWEEGVNLGLPYNSTADDLDYAVNSNGITGFFVSNRPGGESLYHSTCCDDIYAFQTVKDPIIINCEIEVLNDKNGDCLNDSSTVNIYMVDQTGKLLVQQINSAECAKKLNLRPNQNYFIEVKKEGYLPSYDSLTTKDITESTNLTAKLKLKRRPIEPIVLKNIRYEFDRAELTPASRITIDTTLLVFFKKYPNAIIELGSHTDSKGSDEYNIKLSQRRAESVVNYLITKGIRKEQLIAKGYGETVPIAPNEKPDGSDNPEGRDANRRTEFKIVGEYEPIYGEEEEIEVPAEKEK